MLNYLKLCLIFGTLSVSNTHKVEEFTDKQFADKIGNVETALVMFYAPWCGHCKKLKPEFQSASEVLAVNTPPVSLIQVDCTEGGKDTCEKYGVSGYPTLKIFKHGELDKEYNGPRDSAGIVKYMKSQLGPSSQELSSLEHYEAVLKKDEVVVIGFFEKESDLKGEFLKIADKLREKCSFAHTSSAEILSKAGLKDNIKLCRPHHLHNKFEDDCVLYDGEPHMETLKAFINKNYHGLAGLRTRDNTGDFQEPLVIAYLTVDYVKTPKITHYWRNRVLMVAKKFSPEVNFAVSHKEDFRHEIEDIRDALPKKNDDPFVAARDAKGNRYVMTEEFNVENFERFVKNMLDGKLEAHIKSQPIPEDVSGPVTVAVGKNFNDVITESGKDAFVEFYAPWCGHCKKLEPIWNELGEKFKDEDVLVAKMDATENDWPKNDYQVSGYPTIYWKPKDAKPVRYEGGRTLKDFIKYAAEHATSELKGWDRKGKSKAVKEEL